MSECEGKKIQSRRRKNSDSQRTWRRFTIRLGDFLSLVLLPPEREYPSANQGAPVTNHLWCEGEESSEKI